MFILLHCKAVVMALRQNWVVLCAALISIMCHYVILPTLPVTFEGDGCLLMQTKLLEPPIFCSKSIIIVAQGFFLEVQCESPNRVHNLHLFM